MANNFSMANRINVKKKKKLSLGALLTNSKWVHTLSFEINHLTFIDLGILKSAGREVALI